MSVSGRRIALILVIVTTLLLGGLIVDELHGVLNADRATITITNESGHVRGTVEARVADTVRERYIGLSDTESLDRNEGLLFVHDSNGTKTYVMREMSFPIDIIFIDADRTITTIHHARPEEPPLTHYEGRARWVLEVSFNWTRTHEVEVGDRVQIRYGS